MAELLFQVANKPQGFASAAMAHSDGSPDPVIRELLQNSLDAAQRGTPSADWQPLEVRLEVRKCDIEQIPGIESYRAAYLAARSRHNNRNAPPSVRETIRRIDAVLGGQQVEVLYCIDTGCGLNAERMRALLSEGMSDKPQSAAGSFGVGHLSAFAASDLRYVFYAGRARDDGELQTLCGGHAVLADHKADGHWRSADGFWAEDGQVDLFDGTFPAILPSFVREDVKAMESTGVVVAVIGFNRFGDGRGASVVSSMARVAATNFLIAIATGKMRVRIRDQVSGDQCVVDDSNLEEHLSPHADRQRSRRGAGGGWLPGAQAYAAWETIASNRRLPCGGGKVLWFRPLPSVPSARTRVNLFRRGMWITNAAPRLRSGDFGAQRPFDAVLGLEEGDLCELVRSAEPPEHRGLEPRRLSDGDQDSLKQELRRIAEILKREAGDLVPEDRFRPDGFALLEGNTLRPAEALRPFFPRLRVQPEARPDGPRPSRTSGARPKPGPRLDIRATLRPVARSNGRIEELRAVVNVPDQRLTARSMLGLRVRRDSGSDASCARPLPAEWLEMREVRHGGGIATASEGAARELAIPPARTLKLLIRLSRPIADTRGLAIDIVHRPKPANNAAELAAAQEAHAP